MNNKNNKVWFSLAKVKRTLPQWVANCCLALRQLPQTTPRTEIVGHHTHHVHVCTQNLTNAKAKSPIKHSRARSLKTVDLYRSLHPKTSRCACLSVKRSLLCDTEQAISTSHSLIANYKRIKREWEAYLFVAEGQETCHWVAETFYIHYFINR